MQNLKLKPIRALFALILSMALLFTACTAPQSTLKNANATTTNATEKSTGTDLSYETAIFGQEMIQIDILADTKTWQTMLDNATEEAYIKVDISVNGTVFHDVGIRPKGNSSLRDVASSDSDRYSFRIKFDEYVQGQTCFGLDNLVVNNMISDNTYLKEYLSYDIMKTIGVETPYFGFSQIKVNGKPWGFYLAVEVYNDSYETRVTGNTDGMLYNVKMNMDKAMGNGLPAARTLPTGAATLPKNGVPTENSVPVENGVPAENGLPLQNGLPMGMGRGMGNSTGSLLYTDDNPNSYGAIFENVVGEGTEADFAKVIKAIKALNTDADLEAYFDVDAILRYLAAHTVVVNLDSYSSNMAQNYYLYEVDGKVTILPWDYNMAWGGFETRDASSVVNFPIDTPVSNVALKDRPLIEKLLTNQTYLSTYHQYLQDILDQYFANDKFATKIETLKTLIGDSVKNDPSAFCTYEDFQKAIDSLKILGELRAQSIQGQLSGTIPATTDAQLKEPTKLVDSSTLQMSDLGKMIGGKGGHMPPISPQISPAVTPQVTQAQQVPQVPKTTQP